MEIVGQITEIIYQNETNCYTVAEFTMENEITTVVGYLPFINKGDSLKLFGKIITHQDYGEQFKIETFEKIMPQTLEALTNYLGSGAIKGVGPATARKIVDKFGEETIAIIKMEPEKLSYIKGITKTKAIEIAEEFMEKWGLWQIVGFLEKFGIGAQNSKKVYEMLGKDAVQQIEKNPYILLDITYGVDFNKIDKMAIDLGVSRNDEKRIESAIKYSLTISSNNGHTCVIKENLIKFVKDLLGVDETDIEESLINLNVQQRVILETRDEETYAYLNTYYFSEKFIAERLIALNNAENMKKVRNFKAKFKGIEENSSIFLSKKQRHAIEAVNENNICIITGGPGTGKTTIIKFIIDLYKNIEKKKVILCAPTGRAAKRMSEATGEEASTIHRLLEIGKMEETLDIEKLDYPISPIDGDVIIIDEMSMVDTFLMNYILKGVYLGTKLILVGDVNQLASVGAGNVLKDIINSGKITTIELNEIFRQAAQSKIVTNAHKVNNGENFFEIQDIEEKMVEDFFFINEVNQEKMISDIISLCSGRLKKYGEYDFFENIQVLTPTKKGIFGTKELNKLLQKALNGEQKEEKKYGETVFKIGDRVMQVKNNYDISWEQLSGETGSGIFNGEIGRVEEIDEVSKALKISFDDGKKAWYEFNELEQIEHSYSITIHKSQGSEFDVVIMCVPQASPMLLTRNLLYTGMTRAKKLLILLGNKNVIEFMIKNIDVKKRNTGLEYKLKTI